MKGEVNEKARHKWQGSGTGTPGSGRGFDGVERSGVPNLGKLCCSSSGA